LKDIRTGFRIAGTIFVSAIFFMLFFFGTEIASDLKNREAELKRADIEIDEYRAYKRLNGKILTPADCIGLVMKCFGEPTVRVITPTGSFSFTPDLRYYTLPNFFSEEFLTGFFPLETKYRCKIVHDANGAIEAIELQEENNE
jgi:hypothetical protein